MTQKDAVEAVLSGMKEALSEGSRIAIGILLCAMSFGDADVYKRQPLHDAVAVAALTAPELLDFKALSVEVELTGDYCRGATVADWYGLFGKAPNVKVAMGIDRDKFFSWIKSHLEKYGRSA